MCADELDNDDAAKIIFFLIEFSMDLLLVLIHGSYYYYCTLTKIYMSTQRNDDNAPPSTASLASSAPALSVLHLHGNAVAYRNRETQTQ